MPQLLPTDLERRHMTYVPKDAELRSYHVESQEAQVREHLALISRRLREMADRIDRSAEDLYWGTAIHELMWGLANLNLDGLAGRGAELARFQAIQAALDGEDGQEAREGLAAP